MRPEEGGGNSAIFFRRDNLSVLQSSQVWLLLSACHGSLVRIHAFMVELVGDIRPTEFFHVAAGIKEKLALRERYMKFCSCVESARSEVLDRIYTYSIGYR